MENSPRSRAAIARSVALYVDPTKFELLLVGPRVAQLKPFFVARGYRADPVVTGKDALAALSRRVRDLVIVELNLGDMKAVEFVSEARELNVNLGVILLENADRAGQIVKALVHGIDAYVATPPDEVKLFGEIERQLMGVMARQQMGDEGTDLKKLLEAARSEVTQFRMQSDLVRQELDSVQAELDRAHSRLENNDDAETAAQYAVLQTEVETLQERSHQADIVELELRNLGVDDDDLLEGIRWIGEQLGQLGEANVSAAMARAEADDLKAELDKNRSLVTSLSGADERAAALEESAGQLDTLSQQKSDAEALAQTRAEEIERLQGELDRLGEDIRRADSEAEERAVQLRVANAAREEVEQQRAALADSLQGKHSELQAAEASISEANAKLTTLESEIEAAKAAVESADARAMESVQPKIADRLAGLDTDRAALEEERAAAEKLRDEAEERILVVEIEFDELQAKIDDLETKLAASETEVREERRRRVEERELGSGADYAKQVEELLAELRQVKRERDAALAEPA